MTPPPIVELLRREVSVGGGGGSVDSDATTIQPTEASTDRCEASVMVDSCIHRDMYTTQCDRKYPCSSHDTALHLSHILCCACVYTATLP